MRSSRWFTDSDHCGDWILMKLQCRLYNVGHHVMPFTQDYRNGYTHFKICKCRLCCKFIRCMSNTRKMFHRDQSKCALCDTEVTRFPHNHRLSPPRLLIAVSLSLPPQGRRDRRGEQRGVTRRGDPHALRPITPIKSRDALAARVSVACMHRVFQNVRVISKNRSAIKFLRYFKVIFI